MEEVFAVERNIRDLLILIAGSFILSIGINYFVIPNQLSEGGVFGITIVTYYLFEWSPGIVNFVLNTTLVVIGYRYFTKRTIIYTIIAIILNSIFLIITEGWGEAMDDRLLAALFAGLAVGLGIGMIFRAGGTTGGTTILANMMNKLLGTSVGSAMLGLDILVIAGSAFVIGRERAMYTLISVYIGAKIIDMLIEGAEERSAVMIISEKNIELLNAILVQMSRGVTVMEAEGGYTRENRDILYLVINKREIVQLRKLVEDIDADAYVTVHRVQEVFRSGYKGRKA
ncbi:YitT family protein [Salimicrobium album]|uniref:YitT family protein n=1 Tax=Salimicrobium album TaxID=50717 RepID=UPI000970AD16|nr:YitT family protein [Salimicrobium album]